MAAKLTRLTHKIAIKLQLVAESFIIYSSRSGQPNRKLMDTPMYVRVYLCCAVLCVGRGLGMGRSPVQGVLPK